MNFFGKIKQGLTKTREQVFGQIQSTIFAATKIDDELLEEIEDLLISGDVGVDTANDIINRLQERTRRQRVDTPDQLYDILQQVIREMLTSSEFDEKITNRRPAIVLVVGVNGTGKTTSIAKLAAHYQEMEKHVMLVAADTFRAAAIEQLQVWADRAAVDIVKHQSGADPAVVVFDAIQAARARQTDIVFIDTAGRLHTRVNLMEELKKIHRVIQKEIPDAPHQVLLVLDAGIGQNAVIQARQFIEAVGVTGIVLTKLDGTAKGGAVIGISHQLKIPVCFIGVGEKIDDLQPFDPDAFVEALFKG